MLCTGLWSWCISTTRDEFLWVEASFPVKVSWRGVTPLEAHHGPLSEWKLASSSPSSQMEAKSFPGCAWAFAARPHSGWSCSQQLETTLWRAPFQAQVSSWHLSVPPCQQGHFLCCQEINCNSAEPSGHGHRRVCLYSCCLCLFPLLLWGSIATGTSYLPHTPPTIFSSSCY